MPKVVINSDWGGFSLSTEAILWLRERGHAGAIAVTLKGEKWPDSGKVNDMDFGGHYLDHDYNDDSYRADPLLVECVETLGTEVASGRLARLKVTEVPDDVEWYIHEYDGIESVYEEHRSWG